MNMFINSKCIDKLSDIPLFLYIFLFIGLIGYFLNYYHLFNNFNSINNVLFITSIFSVPFACLINHIVKNKYIYIFTFPMMLGSIFIGYYFL